MKATRIASWNDLLTWVCNHADPRVRGVECQSITNAIVAMDHPRYGSDWSKFLESLPELVDLIEAAV